MSHLAEFDQAGQLGELGVIPLLIPALIGVGGGGLVSWLWTSDTTRGESGSSAKVNYDSAGARAANLDRSRIIEENVKKLQYFQTTLDDMRATYNEFLRSPDGGEFKRRLDEMDRWRVQIQIPRFNDAQNYFVSFDANVTRRTEDLAALNKSMAAAADRWLDRKAKSALPQLEKAPDPVSAERDLIRANPFPWFTTGAKSPSDVAREIRISPPNPIRGTLPDEGSGGRRGRAGAASQATSLLSSPYVIVAALAVAGLAAYMFLGGGGSSAGPVRRRASARRTGRVGGRR